MTNITIAVFSFLVMAAVYVAPHMSETSGVIAAISNLALAVIFFIIQLILYKMGKKMNNWKPIETAPKDGTVILLADNEMENIVEMRWDATMTNGLYTGEEGFWTTPDRSMTWDHRGGFGPDKWMQIQRH